MQDNTDLPSESSSMILFYQTEDGKSRIEVKLEEGTVWLTQAMISELYQTSKQNVTLHINNILRDEELDNSTVKEYLTVQSEGKRDVQRKILFYNLSSSLILKSLFTWKFYLFRAKQQDLYTLEVPQHGPTYPKRNFQRRTGVEQKRMLRSCRKQFQSVYRNSYSGKTHSDKGIPVTCRDGCEPPIDPHHQS
jgi:hypothetical protein